MIKYSTLIIFLFINFFQVFSQQKGPRPKVGLVLSGGGAKGLAHTGVIRALEEAGLTPDYITGTSMGSVVGALYAIGYSADDIEHMASSVDWDAVLSNEISFDQITYEEKAYYGRYIAELPVEGLKVGFPKGLIEGQKLSELLTRLTRSVHDIEDFHKFPIPFTCVATDIATGEPVILNSGSLPEAIRASMAIPTVFTPVEIDGKLLVDGGLVRNFPVEEVIAMGADIVIGVFVSSELDPKEDLNNMISLLAQSAFVTSARDTREQKKKVDIYIEPNLDGYSTGSFKQFAGIIERGNEAGRKYVDTFKKIADSLKRFGDLKTFEPLPLKDEFLISKIVVEGNEKISSKLIMGKLRIKKGSRHSIDEIEKRISIIFGTRYFDKVTYEIAKKGDKYELKIKVQESTDGKLKLAVHYDSENNIGINANLTYRNLLLPHSRALLEIDFSESPRVNLNFLKYIGAKQSAAVMLGLDYSNNERSAFENNIEAASLDANYYNLFFQIQSTGFQNFTFGGRYQFEYSNIKPIVGEFGKRFEVIKNRDLSVKFFAKYNSFDSRYYPKKGMDFNVSYKYAFDIRNKITLAENDSLFTGNPTVEENYDPFGAFETYFTYIFKISNRFSVISKSAFVLTSLEDLTSLENDNLNFTDYYFLGGFNPRFNHVSEYWGSQDKEYLSPNYFYTKLVLQYELFNKLFVSGIVNYIDVEYPMSLIYDISVGDNLGGERRRFGYGLSIGYNSPLGPISFSIANDTKNDDLLTNFSLGFLF